MEVRKGYKLTEIGVIPEDWEVKTYGDIFSYLATATYSRAELTENNDVRYIHYGDIHTQWNFFLDIEESILPTVRDVQVKNYQLLKEGDVIMADASEDYSGVGKSVEVKNLGSLKAISGLHTFLLRDKNEVFVNGFRGYIHINKTVKTQFDRLATGLKVYGVSKGNLKTVKIPIPTKAEQAAIAIALSDADALISSLEKLIKKKRNIKQGAMQKLLQPKEGWVHKTLGEIGVVTGAGVDKKIYEDEMPVRLVNYMDVFKRDYIYSNELNHWVTAPAYKAQKCAVQRGDIFFTPSSEMRYDIAISAVAMENIPDAAYSYHLIRLRLFEDWNLNFRAYVFKTKCFFDQAEQICEGSGKRYVISLPKFRGMKIYFPPMYKEQTRIATILSDMDAEIAALETKLEKYRNIKLGMMQNLLTGRIRLV